MCSEPSPRNSFRGKPVSTWLVGMVLAPESTRHRACHTAGAQLLLGAVTITGKENLGVACKL